MKRKIGLLMLGLAGWGCSGSTGSGGTTGGTTGSAAGGVQVTFSGETFGATGLPFSPSAAQDADPYFVDGWSLAIDEYLVSVGNIRLSPNATKNQDQSVVEAPVAKKAGPYVLDVHKPTGLVGSDGVSPAQALFTWDKRDDGTAFDTAMRYAFSYDVVPATASATKVNLSASQDADVALMVQKGWTKLVRGTATYAGPTPVAPFDRLPKTVKFQFGFNDATQALNCVNPEFGDENTPANRGVQPTSSKNVVAQLTVHVDHMFWDKLKVEGTPLRFDPVAAWAPTDGGVLDLATLNTKPLATTFADGTKLPDRGPTVSAAAGFQSDQADPGQVVLDPAGVPGITNLAAFLAFSTQSQLHLNADGVCYVKGQQAADPYYQPNIQP